MSETNSDETVSVVEVDDTEHENIVELDTPTDKVLLRLYTPEETATIFVFFTSGHKMVQSGDITNPARFIGETQKEVSKKATCDMCTKSPSSRDSGENILWSHLENRLTEYISAVDAVPFGHIDQMRVILCPSCQQSLEQILTTAIKENSETILAQSI